MVLPVIGAAAIGAAGSIAGGLLGRSAPPKTSSKWYRNQVKDLYGQASDIADQPFVPYTDPRYADFTPDQLAAMGMVKDNLGLGSGAVNSAIGAAQNAMGYTPQTVNALGIGVNYNPSSISNQTVSGAYGYTPQQVSGAFGYTPDQVSSGTITAQQIKDKAFTDYNLNDYLNPWTQNVIDRSLNDINIQSDRAQNSLKADAMAAGAWGGSRSGVAQGLTGEAYAKQAADTSAALRAQGYDTAANLIMQDANRNLTASQSNQSADLQAQMTTAQLATQAAIANQAANLQSAMFGANLGQNAALANQSAGMQNAQFGANLGLQAGLANQDANLRAQLANLQSQQFGANLGLNAAQSNQNAYLNAAMANQAAGLQANNQQLYGANLLGSLGAQQQSMGAMDAQNLMTVGNMQQTQAQKNADFAYQQWLQQQAWPQQQLSWQQSFLTNPFSQQLPQGNSALGIMGGAIMGNQLATGIYDAYNQSQQDALLAGMNNNNVNNFLAGNSTPYLQNVYPNFVATQQNQIPEWWLR